ncbi:hypothetical protein NJH78_26330 [Pseudomonas chlororaphis]|uniref:hypothetical protein n=1 Tax=Pseudomonas chlororaphis TaxID=587753 RepID=UPI00209B8191|nr:hypothetical protein [Pseudomonas chlororaphis]MCO7573513.1 hypothetical protein [Pseudomonas chlororaphis]MCO7592330.1 hypothetical protein [Pseudomonas chlororaphis]
MANEEQTPMAAILLFAEKYLNRPLNDLERQALQAFVQDQPLDMAKSAQQSVDQARQRAVEMIEADQQRTRKIIEQLSGVGVDRADPQARELLLRQLQAAAESQAAAATAAPTAVSEPTATPSADNAGAATATPAPAPVDDPALKAMISALVQQEVKAAVEARMAELSQKVEDTLKQVLAAAGQ